MSHERSWFPSEMDFKASLKCISSMTVTGFPSSIFVAKDEPNRKRQWDFFRKTLHSRLTHFDNQRVPETNFLGKKLIIARVSVHWECRVREEKKKQNKSFRHCFDTHTHDTHRARGFQRDSLACVSVDDATSSREGGRFFAVRSVTRASLASQLFMLMPTNW